VRWSYDWKAEAGSEEARLTDYFLQDRDWLGVVAPKAAV
jgi:coproporphyrinogen III oxidase